jgi:hypothetical protein
VAQARLVLLRQDHDLGLGLVLERLVGIVEGGGAVVLRGGAGEADSPRLLLALELLQPRLGRVGGEWREAARHAREPRQVGRRDLDGAEEGGRGPVDGVVRRAGADHAPAARADAEHHRPAAAAGEDAGGDARVGQQAGERLAVRDHVGVHDDEAVLAVGELGDQLEVGLQRR